MKTILFPSDNGLRLTGLVILLALASALSLAGCQSHAVANVPATTLAEIVMPNPLAGMLPVHPIDDRPITPMETVGASKDD